MKRYASQLRHDYRPTALSPIRRSRHRLPWFSLGILLAIAGAGLWRFAATPETATARPTTLATQAEDAQRVVTSAGIVPTPSVAQANRATPPSTGDVAMVAAAVSAATTTLSTATTHRFEHVDLTIRSGDTLDGLFRKNELSAGDLASISRLPVAAERLRLLRPGDTIAIDHDNGRVVSLRKTVAIDKELRVGMRADGGFVAEVTNLPLETREAISHGVIESSLFESAATAGLDDNMIMNLAGIFAWDIDFVLDIRRGDEYTLLYEEHWRNGEKIGNGEIIAAEFINSGRSVQAFRHIDDTGRSDYFAADGRSVRKAFIRAPVDFRRISSVFNPNRRHPILNTIRAHRGVDYSAPKGTPIKAAGDGKVIFRGRKNGYGNTVILQHGGNITTLYAHLSNFAKKAPSGARVRQGETIGFVGATGLATAPHLHYEYRVNGVHRNPRTVKLPAAEPIDSRYVDDFRNIVEDAQDRLEKYKETRLARID
ncbi:MAG: peptidoglycan DD-metalloendopeptidase family protein [Pseudomonadota bacterium]